MKTIDGLFAGIGVIVAGFLTWHAYYSNLHREIKHIDELFYIVLFPPSIGLMVTENASRWDQVFIVLVVVLANGALYGIVSILVREIFGTKQSR